MADYSLRLIRGESRRFQGVVYQFDRDKSTQLGGGTQGSVWEGTRYYPSGLSDKIACKYIDDVSLRHVTRERKFVGRFQHDHLVNLFDDFEIADGRVAVVLCMELCQESLAHNLSFGQTLSPLNARHVFAQLLSAVSYLHEQGVRHRDLKPANVLCMYYPNNVDGLQYQIKVADYGLAANAESDVSKGIGTPTYRAPEMHIRDAKNTAALDIWSLGCILFRIIVGFDIMSDNFIAHLWSQRRVRSRDLQPAYDVNEEAGDLIRAMLKFNPADRITLEEIKRHPFVRNMYNEVELDRLQNYVITLERRISALSSPPLDMSSSAEFGTRSTEFTPLGSLSASSGDSTGEALSQFRLIEELLAKQNLLEQQLEAEKRKKFPSLTLTKASKGDSVVFRRRGMHYTLLFNHSDKSPATVIWKKLSGQKVTEEYFIGILTSDIDLAHAEEAAPFNEYDLPVGQQYLLITADPVSYHPGVSLPLGQPIPIALEKILC